MSFSDSENEKSFNHLLVYLHNLRRSNPHTHIHIKTDLMDRFLACFLAIGWVIHFFSNFIFLYLRGDYLKTMFVAVAKDGNNQTFPIAFSMAVENNLDNCTCFLMSLKESFGNGREVAFISNMDDVVSSCINIVFTDSYHGYTCNSVHKYIRTRVSYGRSLDPLFWMTLKAYTMSIFEQNFARLSCDAHELLANISNLKWARDYVPNILLSLNQHNVSIITLIEEIREYMQRTFVERSLTAGSLTTVLTPHAEMVLHKRIQKSVRLGIACGHAITTVRHSNMHELVDMVKVFYHADVFQIVCQTQTIYPVPPQSEWEIPDPLMVVLLPM
uniref:MULE transposase domain-containing protein n=1 Tax=Lactuca sativa TaxID=4236 RepID=A0A9R1WDB3_LACSA|nr:hypothetical protein LSAT_V11C200054970 [Lactuca sativa]